MATPTPTYLDESYHWLTNWETPIAWLYLDIKGWVTTAIGLQVVSALAALNLKFMSPDGSRPATPAEIENDYARVRGMPYGQQFGAKFYKSATSPLLPDVEQHRLLVSQVNSCETDLRRIYPGYDSMPDPAKIALIDMRYNLGPVKLAPPKYPLFNAAVAKRDWLTASQQCARNVNDKGFAERNLWTKNEFLDASIVAPLEVPNA